jgi:excisionase family DNA binding protein
VSQNGSTAMTDLSTAIRSALPELYLTPQQVADMLQISKRSVYRLSKDPTFPKLELGGIIRVPRAKLETWLKRREQGQSR